MLGQRMAECEISALGARSRVLPPKVGIAAPSGIRPQRDPEACLAPPPLFCYAAFPSQRSAMKKDTTSPAAFPQAEIGREMKGADCVVECLIREGVDVIFAYPGGASQELHQALARTDRIRVILPRHEQGGSFAAEGYARATGNVGVCMATSGPGATNLVSAIADAFMDSIPMVAITGQVYSKYIGKMAFQETDFYGMTLPVVKHSYLVMDVRELPRIFKESFYLARSGRPGPVVIDIPKDVQQAKFQPVFPASVEFRSTYASATQHATDAQLKHVLGLIAEAKRPVLYCGGGIISAGAQRELRAFAEKSNIPVATTLMGVGAFPETHPLSMQWFGMHGAAYGNWAVDQSDLLLTVGARFDDRITGDTGKFAAGAHIVHIDIDASEHNKNKRAHLPIVSDVKYALGRLNELAAALKFSAPDTGAWHAQINTWKRDHPFGYEPSKHIQPQEAVQVLYELTKGDAIITTGVGQHQMWAAQFYRFDEPRRYISSLGLGAMGFGYPAALGAKVACPDKQVIDIDGDGSFMMNIQELATAKIENIAAKAMILNNQHLGMVVQWEDRFYGSIRGNTILGDESNVGSPDNPDALYPDFVKIAEGFGVKGRRVIKKSELRAAIQEMLDHNGPYVLDVVVPFTEHVLPMIPAGRSVKDMLLK
jgi:acetolactate synthase I/II/III large subunit